MWLYLPVDPSRCGEMGYGQVRMGRVYPCPVYMARVARNVGSPVCKGERVCTDCVSVWRWCVHFSAHPSNHLHP